MKYLVYSKENCPWCDRAKELLVNMNVEYEEFVYGKDFTKEELTQKLGGKDRITVPQIFLGEDYVGTYEDLRHLMEGRIQNEIS